MEFAFLLNILVALYKISVSSNRGETAVHQDPRGDIGDHGEQLGNHSILHRVNLTRSSCSPNLMFRFKGVASGKCMDSQAYPPKRQGFFSDDIDTMLRIWPCAPVLKQTFVVFVVASTGESLIISEANKCIGTGPGSNILIQAYDCSYDPVKYNLYWKVVAIPKTNRVQIVAAFQLWYDHKQCMTTRGRNNGDEVVVGNCNAGWTDQLWEMST